MKQNVLLSLFSLGACISGEVGHCWTWERIPCKLISTTRAQTCPAPQEMQPSSMFHLLVGTRLVGPTKCHVTQLHNCALAGRFTGIRVLIRRAGAVFEASEHAAVQVAQEHAIAQNRSKKPRLPRGLGGTGKHVCSILQPCVPNATHNSSCAPAQRCIHA